MKVLPDMSRLGAYNYISVMILSSRTLLSQFMKVIMHSSNSNSHSPISLNKLYEWVLLLEIWLVKKVQRINQHLKMEINYRFENEQRCISALNE